MKRTILTIAGVYALQLFVLAPLLWPDPAWDLAMIPLNLIAARIILWQPAGRMQGVIGASFIPQALIHLGRVINGAESNMDFHFWGLTVIGILQLLCLGGWFFGDWVRRHHRHRVAGPLASPAYRASIEP